ncbi:DUF4097 family beta strand repeat-containing protein [Actinomadura litoris]|uniref:DUF4097 family beta strand repeat-containing protein n=1 Tax=Actinomadura litoris TaxID=2678616 RepID=UPI001FA79120|nr:DUF4097 family beta strand repeat-containing protein [Actinomadura litoris]
MPAFTTPEPITADVQVFLGRVRVNAADRADTVVEVRPSDPSSEASVQAAERTVVEFSAGRLLVKSPRPKALAQLLPWRGSVEVTIDLPAGSRVRTEGSADVITTGALGHTTLHTSNGDLHVEEAGPLEIKTSNGDITVDRVTGPTEAVTSNGAIRIGTIDGPGTAKTSTGAITVAETTGDLHLKAATGDINVGRALGVLTAKAAHGRIRVETAVSGALHLENGYGKVGVGVAEGTAAWLDLHSKNGVVRNTLEAADGPATTDAVVEIHVHTNYGDVDVHRS